MKIMKWICKKWGHKFTAIDSILVDMAMVEIQNYGVTADLLTCSRCKTKFSIQKIYDLTHDGVERTPKEIIELTEVK